MDHFNYRDRVLHCEDVPLAELAEKHGTPLFVYSQATLLHHLNQIQTAFAEAKPVLAFSIKTNGNIHIAKLMREYGSGFDVTSGGELYRALLAGGDPKQITNNQHSISSAFTWHPGGQHVAFVMDRSVCVVDIATGVTTRVTERRADEESSPRADACVVSPDGSKIAFIRRLTHSDGGEFNQVCVVPFPPVK